MQKGGVFVCALFVLLLLFSAQALVEGPERLDAPPALQGEQAALLSVLPELPAPADASAPSPAHPSEVASLRQEAPALPTLTADPNGVPLQGRSSYLRCAGHIIPLSDLPG